MTVIAAYVIGNFPVLFGDLLLTSERATGARKVAVPTQGEVQDFFGSSGWGISGLTQKVNVLSDNCAIAWAGSWLGARVAIAGLRDLALSRTLTCEAILEFFDALPDLKLNPASFVGLVHDDGALQQFCFNAEQFQSESLGTVYLSGTGSTAIYELSDILAGADSQMTGSPNSLLKLSRNLVNGDGVEALNLELNKN
jgi:hypothetical protein